MSIIDHVVSNDNFEVQEAGLGFAFPCNVCVHNVKADDEEPCVSCGHNMNNINNEDQDRLKSQSIAEQLNDDWEEVVCKCGLGEPHYRYNRADCGSVSRDHSACGSVLKDAWIGGGNLLGDEINSHRSALAAIRKVDQLFPIDSEFRFTDAYRTGRHFVNKVPKPVKAKVIDITTQKENRCIVRQ